MERTAWCRVHLMALAGCLPLLACGGSSATNDPCVVAPLGIQAADQSTGQIRQASTACARYVVVEAVQFAAPASFPAHSYTVTLRNDASTEVDLASVALQGFYSPDPSVDGADQAACGATMSGKLSPGSTRDVVVPCDTPPANDDTYLLVRVNKNDASFRLPR